jgi:hypothetical protein
MCVPLVKLCVLVCGIRLPVVGTFVASSVEVMLIKVKVFWIVMPCNAVVGYHHFKGLCYFLNFECGQFFCCNSRYLYYINKSYYCYKSQLIYRVCASVLWWNRLVVDLIVSFPPTLESVYWIIPCKDFRADGTYISQGNFEKLVVVYSRMYMRSISEVFNFVVCFNMG